MPELRESVGPYRLIRAIGAGGSARIDLARIERAYSFQRHVVVKRPLEHLRGDRNVAASLRREARIGGRLQHPNLVAVLDAGEHDGYDYLVLEYVHGASLRTLMQMDAPNVVRDVPLNVALGIAIDVARGLHDAHELTDEHGAPLGLVHRDVSPGNVLLGLDGAVKVADFGIAKETRVATLSGSMHGTVTYMAPEQCRGHAFDRRADLFSLGVILYELVTRRRLFWADNDVASLHRVLSGDIERPRRIVGGLSAALEEIVMTALAADPMKRFATAKAMADALEALAADEGHVVGARWLARTVEEVVGAKAAPWIAATTVADAEGKGEGSLVGVIEAAPAVEGEDAPIATFGVEDRRDREEGEVPSSPAMRAPAPAPVPEPKKRRGGTVAAVIGGVVVVIAIAVAVGRWSAGSQPQPQPQPQPTPQPQPQPQPQPTPQPTPPPPTAADTDTAAVTDTATAAGSAAPAASAAAAGSAAAPATANPPRHRKRHPQPPVATGSGSATTEPPANPNVEWKRTLLLPTDTGSGHK
jgi:serine/threonine-protein kinase